MAAVSAVTVQAIFLVQLDIMVTVVKMGVVMMVDMEEHHIMEKGMEKVLVVMEVLIINLVNLVNLAIGNLHCLIKSLILRRTRQTMINSARGVY